MCGFAGYLCDRGAAPGQAVLLSMGDRLAHRGPDGSGVFEGLDGRLGLVHRRLAILDLSEAGSQPMESPGGRYVIAYNGEIYNHVALRDELDAAGARIPWRGHSDTETLLALVEEKGLAHALQRIRGMFAFALWDRAERTLTLVRDRMGEKPLYFGRIGGMLVFASELEAFRGMPRFSPGLDSEAVESLLRYACIPAPASIYEGIGKLRPGHLVVLDTEGTEPVQTPYWRLSEVIAATASARDARRPYAEMVEATEAVLTRVVGEQTISDVPVGTFLSGGIDSTLVTALLAGERGGDAVRTYSIGFESARFNEADAAREVAAHLGTRHTEFIVTEADALSVVGELGRLFSEPFADASQIPLVLLSRLTRRDVTVALSGDGGDEMFGGYNRHLLAPKLWAMARRVPTPVRRAGAALAGRAAGLSRDGVADRLMPLARRMRLPHTVFDRIGHFGRVFGRAADFRGLYAGLIQVAEQEQLLGRTAGATLPPGAREPLPDGLGGSEALMVWDALWYLPDDVLVKVDRSAMSASLETRAPFLDVDAVEAAWSLPIDAKIGREGKRVLRDILYRRVPRALVERPKQGFAAPLDAWLRGPLRDWAGDRLFAAASVAGAEIDHGAVEALWNAHQSGRVNAGSGLWPVIMLADWHEQARDQSRRAA